MAKNHEDIFEVFNTVDADETKSKNVTNNDDSNDVDLEELENADYYINESNVLRKFEKQFKQPINLTYDEKKNPLVFKEFLNHISKKFSLTIDTANSSNLFKPTKHNQLDFERHLDNAYEERLFEKSSFRFYIFIVLLMRKSMPVNTDYFNGLSKNYNFNIQDIYYLDDISENCFKDLNDVPTNIVLRTKLSHEHYSIIAESFIRQFIKLERKHSLQRNEHQNIDFSELSNNEAIEKTQKLQNEIKTTEKEIEDLSFKVKEKLFAKETAKKDTISIDDVARFVTDFVNYAIQIDEDVSNHNKIKSDNGRYYTNDKQLVKSSTLDDLYFENTVQSVWVKSYNAINNHVLRISGMNNITKSNEENILNTMLFRIFEKKSINVISFKPNAIFTQNGVIDLQFESNKLVKHTFYDIKDLSHNDKMFKYATNYRINLIYEPNVDYDFDNYSTGQKITVNPTFIFDALGRRGFETHNIMSADEVENFDNQANERANLLKSFFLNTLILHNDLNIVGKKFLYMYNASNSGKSTFMELLKNTVGKNGSTLLDTKDLDLSKAQFGLINVKDKFLVNIDEATNGSEIIDVETLKKLVTKEQDMSVNQKGKDYITFTPQASFMFASNYAPKFSDESGGTNRRLLAFQLGTGYQERTNDNKPVDLTFIKDELIKQNAFKSACLKYILDTVDTSLPIPQSVIEDGDSITSKEDEIQVFINDRLRTAINEPLIISEKDLYALYTIEMASQGRKSSNIRNISNFKKGLMKIKNGVYFIKRNRFSDILAVNKVLFLEGKLYSDIAYAQDKNTNLHNTIAKHFIDKLEERERTLDKYYNELIEVNDENTNRPLSKCGTTAKNTFVILPNNEIYNDFDETNAKETFRNIANNERNKVNKLYNTIDNIELIKKLQLNTHLSNAETQSINEKLPFSISKKVPKNFHSYQLEKDTNNYNHSFVEFVENLTI